MWLALAVAAGGPGYPSPTQPPPQASQKPVYRQPPSPEQIAQDQAAVVSAKSDYDKANDAEQKVTGKYRSTFETTQDWQTAAANLKSAQDADAAARANVMANLNQNDDYKSAVEDEQKTQGDLTVARANPDATPDILAPLATAYFDAQSKVKKMEDEAIFNDAGVSAAGQKMADAQSAVDQLNDQFQKSLQDKADWKTADGVTQTAKKRFSDAQAKYNSDTQ
jgi:hypothetical protein